MTNVFAQEKTILFTSVGNEAIHGFVDDLRQRAPRWRLIGVDIREDAAGRYRCDVHKTVPRRDAPTFLSTLESLVQEHAVDLVVPLSTEDQDYFARPDVQAVLAPAIVLTSSAEAVRIANRKTALFRHLQAYESWLPEHAFVTSAEHAMQVVPAFVQAHGAMLLKSDASTGGRGMVCVGKPSADLAPAVGRSFLPLDVWEELCHASPATRAATLPSVFGSGAKWPQLANAYLPGEEFSVDVLCDAGESLATVVRRRDAAVGGLATTAQVVDAPDVAARAREIVASVGLSHVVNVQFRRDAVGEPRLMEINPRTPGTIGLTVAAGLNLPLAAFANALGDGAAARSLISAAPQFDTACYRYFDMVVEGAASPRVAVLWDLDRTLCDLLIDIEDVREWKRLLDAHFSSLTPPWDGGWSPMLPSLEAALTRTNATAVQRRAVYADLDTWEHAALKGVNVNERAVRMAARWSEQGVAQGIITNNGPSAAAVGRGAITAFAVSAGISDPTFGAAVTRGPTVAAKPAADMLLAALEGLTGTYLEGLTGTYDTVVVVGDQPGDHAAADALTAATGIATVFLPVLRGAPVINAPTMQRLKQLGLPVVHD